MKATVLLENLLEKISFLNHAISSRPPLPILSGFLLKTEKGRLNISATDLDLGITTSAPAVIEEEGKVVVPAKPFIETLTNLSEEKITITAKDGSVELLGKTTKAKFIAMDPAEFPKILEEKGEDVATFKGASLEKDFGRVVFAASADSGRPAFSAIVVKKDKEGLVVVATDSHRLSLNKIISLANKTEFKKPILVSSRAVRALLSQKNEEDVVVSLFEKAGQVVFSFGETVLTGRLIEAEFPDFEKIIPDSFSTKAEFNREEMLKALRVASVFAKDNANIVKLSVKKDKITVSAKSQSVGENSVEVSAKTSGEDNEIAFNARYLMDLLQNVSDEQMVFEMQGPLNPGVFKVYQNQNFIHLIMPIRIKEEDLE